eukprot:CAMPEP_0176373156 /NCGR_PEP_ID=MMETSP0126-20121128/25857_1 /TAXON_ID=141414 ORGANISM="Strombidinopsis acuminatum, Strain SPMC142" /NCGR_SAMPLE_ID=MMETSP0126 /ASSEMBLY_ACC=CAM_ASM_000229 /LENGTH=100 /DNA_ID=CAMNT_0017733213 /DNA_START=135 /DNA_END=437 /DNA_ORIENTATION=+
MDNYDNDIGAAALESIACDINKIVFGQEDDSEDEDIKPVNIENMTPEEMTAYYRELGLKRLEDMDENEKIMAKKKLQDFIEQKKGNKNDSSRSRIPSAST